MSGSVSSALTAAPFVPPAFVLVLAVVVAVVVVVLLLRVAPGAFARFAGCSITSLFTDRERERESVCWE